jgi:hypothetical protein
MRKGRSHFLYLPEEEFSIQLCHSAFSGPWEKMEPDELDTMRDLLLEHAAFSSLKLLAFSLRPRSFDILVETPLKLELSRNEMADRIAAEFTGITRQQMLAGLLRDDPGIVERVTRSFLSVSFFLKRFKAVVTRAYHRRRNSNGALWESRFSSSYVEPGHTTRVVAAWVDHGCVRDHSATSPEASPHCTIGCAVAGNKPARESIHRIFLPDSPRAEWPEVLHAWQDFCNSEPENARDRNSNLTRTPPLHRAALMRHPVPHFHYGLAIGSLAFTQRMFEANRRYFDYERETGPRFLTGQNDPELFTLRDKGDLRKPPRSARLRGREPQ